MFNIKKKKKIAINGLGRIGRCFLKSALKEKDIEIVAINDLHSLENLSYLVKYDSVYGIFQENISLEIISEEEKYLKIGERKIKYLSLKDPQNLPWKELGVDIVLEATGVFNSFEKSFAHIQAGAKKVLISGPVKEKQDYLLSDGKKAATCLANVNDQNISQYSIVSNASCTTNACAAFLDAISEKIKVENVLLNTVHSFTASQSLVDTASFSSDFRKKRSGASNIIPSSTGSAKAVGKVLEDFRENFDGIALRVPTICGSIADITFTTEKKTDKEQINKFLKEITATAKYKNFLSFTEEPLVSSDIIGNENAGIADLSMTRVCGNLVKILIWYDNEAGYTKTLLENIKNL